MKEIFLIDYIVKLYLLGGKLKKKKKVFSFNHRINFNEISFYLGCWEVLRFVRKRKESKFDFVDQVARRLL